MITWERYQLNPIIKPLPNSWTLEGTMTADLVRLDDMIFFYFIGKSGGIDQLGLLTCKYSDFNGYKWDHYPHNPILRIGPPESFDCHGICDPSIAIDKSGAFWLYYSAFGDGPDTIGLATSSDGYTFIKHATPVITGRAPEVVYRNSVFYLFHLKENENAGYEIQLSTSNNGIDFSEMGPALKPSNSGWDSRSVVTPRIFYESGIYIMTYAGDNESKDYPYRFGHAFSRDLLNWERYAENPVFRTATTGWDSAAIWFGEVFKHEDKYYMFYEGTDRSKSQIGLAFCSQDIADIGKSVIEHL